MAKHHLKGIESTKGQGFDNNPQNINRTGMNRKDKVSKHLENIISQDDVYTLYADVLIDCEINDKGKHPELIIKGEWEIKVNPITEEITKRPIFKIDIPNSEAIAIQWAIDAKSKHSKLRTRSRETLLDRTEGKPKQSIDVTDTRPIKTEIDIRGKTPKEIAAIHKALRGEETSINK